MRRILGPRFFDRPTLAVARSLLGKFLVAGRGGRSAVFMITDVEAYDGPSDRASHARRGETPRNRPMFGPAGVWYVYFVYGMHWMLNIVAGRPGYPAAVLIRGVEGIDGPARVAKALGADGRMSGRPAVRASGLWIEDRGARPPRWLVRRLPRVGVGYAGETWAAKPYRFRLERPKTKN